MPETTAPTARYIATRQNGRPVVLDQTTGTATQTRTKAIAEEKAAKLNRQHQAEARNAAAENAVADFYEQFQASRRGLDNSIRQGATTAVEVDGTVIATTRRIELHPAEAEADAIEAAADAATDAWMALSEEERHTALVEAHTRAAEAKTEQAPKAERKARTPKVAQPGELTRVYRLTPGQTVTVRGIGVVTITEFGTVETDPKLRRIGYLGEAGERDTVELSKDARVLVTA